MVKKTRSKKVLLPGNVDGRPSMYKGDITIALGMRYLASCVDKKGRYVKLPKLSELAKVLGVTRETLRVWADEHPNFSAVTEIIMRDQESALIDNGLNGVYNPALTRLMMAKHGYRETAELVGAGGRSFIPDSRMTEESDKALGAFMKKKSK